MADAVLQAEGVTKDYETRSITTRALDDVTLQIERGEFSVLAGPSGSGKTTLLNLLGTIDAPTRGIVRVDGEDVGAMSERQRSDLRLHHLGFIFQSYNLIPVLSAAENVEFVLLLQGVGAGETRLYTETRIRALGPRARFWFRLYWLITRPFSGLLRRAMLSGIKARAIAYNALISEQPERSV